MKFWIILSVLYFFLCTTTSAEEEVVNPEDVDDVRPPVVEKQPEENVKKTTISATKTQLNETQKDDHPQPVADVKLDQVKPDSEKKEELLTGKEETEQPKLSAIAGETTVVVETNPPKFSEEKEKEEKEESENAAPEFEAKQDVEGGKGEEDPDANVDKPVQADPPKDEADGRAKEDRESAPIGADGLHEAVEEAKGNPAPAAPVIEQKGDSADEEQTLNTDVEKPLRANRLESSQEKRPNFLKIQKEEESSGFMSFFFMASFLVIFIYIIQHNKKKILGLIFEGRASTSSSRRGGNVKYRRLSQTDSVA